MSSHSFHLTTMRCYVDWWIALRFECDPKFSSCNTVAIELHLTEPINSIIIIDRIVVTLLLFARQISMLSIDNKDSIVSLSFHF